MTVIQYGVNPTLAEMADFSRIGPLSVNPGETFRSIPVLDLELWALELHNFGALKYSIVTKLLSRNTLTSLPITWQSCTNAKVNPRVNLRNDSYSYKPLLKQTLNRLRSGKPVTGIDGVILISLAEHNL